MVARRHAWSVIQSPPGNLAEHCDRCPCDRSRISRNINYADKTALEYYDAFCIRKHGESKRVSATSMHLTNRVIFKTNSQKYGMNSAFVLINLHLRVHLDRLVYFLVPIYSALSLNTCDYLHWTDVWKQAPHLHRKLKFSLQYTLIGPKML